MMGGSQKNGEYVDFPLEGLDMRPHIINSDKNEEYIYDCYAVSQHMGSLYGGHYTAVCRNPITGDWYDFNDSYVSKTSSRNVKDESAYVLFYRKRN